MLRDVLCELPDHGTWPCDEIKYIWRHGNQQHPDDELERRDSPDGAMPGIACTSSVRANDVATWGPRFVEMDDYTEHHDLPELCARQWARCVERAEAELEGLPNERVHRVRYDDLVAKPVEELTRLTRFVGVDQSTTMLERLAQSVRRTSVGAWRTELDPAVLGGTQPIVAPWLRRYRYTES
jgi:hypothetical protein